MRPYNKIKRFFGLWIHRLLPDYLDISSKDIKIIDSMVMKRFSKHFKFQIIENIKSEFSYDKNRVFSIVSYSNGLDIIKFFIKSQKYLNKQKILLKELSKHSLPIPEFYGSYRSKGHARTVWRYYDARKILNFNDLTDSELIAICEAIAVFNVSDLDLCVRSYLHEGALWNQPITKKIKHKFMLSPQADKQLVTIEKFETYLLSLLNERCEFFLNHNDIKESNVLIEIDTNEILLSDLDTLSYGPLGLSLRRFSILPVERRKIMVSSYIQSIGKLGILAEDKYIHQMMVIQQIFWGLHTGVIFNEIRRIEQTLELFRRNFICVDEKLILKEIGEVKRVKPPSTTILEPTHVALSPKN